MEQIEPLADGSIVNLGVNTAAQVTQSVVLNMIVCPSVSPDRFYFMVFSEEEKRQYHKCGICPVCNVSHQTELTRVGI